jgi:uncharacterized protein
LRTAPAPDPDAARARASAQRAARVDLFTWARRLHVYISMGTLLLVLFFALTGITLNHPDLAFGSRYVRSDAAGALPPGWTTESGTDWLVVAETLRSEHGVRGQVSDRYEDDFGGQLSFRAPGYAADLFFDRRAATYELVTESEGWVAVLNDLHRGRYAGSAWRWIVDASGVFLIVVSLTGLVLLLLLRKIRPAGLLVALAGAVATVVFGVLALG